MKRFVPIAAVVVALAAAGPAAATPGDLDPTFGTAGKVLTPVGAAEDSASAVAVQPDGKIVVAGPTVVSGKGWSFGVVRYNPDGTLDPGFGAGGKVVTGIGTGDDTPTAVALQQDGKIVVAGSSASIGRSDFAVVRYNPDGTLDTNFDGDGKATT